jgi:hypothetical protein
MEIYTASVGKLLTLTQKADLAISELTRADLVRYRNAADRRALKPVR